MADKTPPKAETKAVATKDATPIAQLHALLYAAKVKEQLKQALADRMNVDTFLRIAITAVQRTPDLLAADKVSILGVCVQVAQLGLSLDPVLGHAYIVPFKDNRRGGRLFAQLIVGYRGFVTLMHRSGMVDAVEAHVVYDNDKFRYQFGLNADLFHIPADSHRGAKRVGAYCVVRPKGGQPTFDYMPEEEIEACRERSRSSDNASSPWKTDTDEMWKKTAVRRKAKLTPLSAEIQQAALVDEYHEAGVTVDVGSEDPTIALASEAAQDELRKKYALGDGGGKPEGERRELTPEENAALDRKIAEEEAAREAAAKGNREPGADG